jgi:twitching motility protein PilU
VADLILRGSFDSLNQAIEKSGVVGMQSFDQVLLQLVQAGRIDQATALDNADSRTDLSLRMRIHSAHDPH